MSLHPIIALDHHTGIPGLCPHRVQSEKTNIVSLDGNPRRHPNYEGQAKAMRFYPQCHVRSLGS